MLLCYLSSGKRLKQQRSMPASTGLALMCHIRFIHSKGMRWAKLPLLRWVRFIISQRHLRWKRTHEYFALPPITLERAICVFKTNNRS